MALIPLEGNTEHSHALFSCAAEVRRTKETSGRTTAAGEPWTSPCTCGIGSHAIFSYKHACYGFQKFLMLMLCFVQKLNGRSNLLVSSIRGSNQFASSGGPHVGVMKLVPVRGMIQAYVQASTSSNKAFSLYGFHFSLFCCCSDSPTELAVLFLLCFSS